MEEDHRDEHLWSGYPRGGPPQSKASEASKDIELIHAIADQDKEAFAILYDRYSARLYGLILKILKNQTWAEDALQDCFLAIWQKAPSFRQNKGNLFPWLVQLCRNRCIDLLRQKESDHKRTEGYSLEISFLLNNSLSQTPIEVFSEQDQKTHVKNLLNRLPDAQRQLIELAFLKGFSQMEMAEKFDLPLGTIKTRIRLGMNKLKRLMKEN